MADAGTRSNRQVRPLTFIAYPPPPARILARAEVPQALGSLTNNGEKTRV
jgi:hypothetical protein